MNDFKVNKEGVKKIDRLISIIIPTYNRKEYLVQAIDSVLNQSYENIEIIIIDDNSDDGTGKLISEIYSNESRIHYLRNNTNKGPGYNRLNGFKKAKGKYVVFLDDDDYYTDYNFFSDAISEFEVNNNFAFVSANNYIKYDGKDKLIENRLNLINQISNKEYLENFQTIKYPKPQSTFTTVFNKEILNYVKLTEVEMVNDTIIYLRALLGGDAAFIENMVGVYRIHKSNISKGCSIEFILKNLNEKLRIYKLAIENDNLKESINKKWLNQQIFVTIDYYIAESLPDLNDFIKIIKWIDKNIEYKKYIQIIKSIKRMIKNSL